MRYYTWGKPALRFKSAIFANFFRSNFFWKAPFFAIFRQQQSAIFAAFRSAKKSAIFRHFSPTTKRHFPPHFAPRKKVPFFAKNFAKNRLDPTHSPKQDHFSTHFAPRKVQFFAIFASRKKCHFSPHFAPQKKVPFFPKKIAKNRLDPTAVYSIQDLCKHLCVSPT